MNTVFIFRYLSNICVRFKRSSVHRLCDIVFFATLPYAEHDQVTAVSGIEEYPV